MSHQPAHPIFHIDPIDGTLVFIIGLLMGGLAIYTAGRFISDAIGRPPVSKAATWSGCWSAAPRQPASSPTGCPMPALDRRHAGPNLPALAGVAQW